MARTRVVIDTDPGVDDAVAIMLALASPELDVVGITTVVGNVELEKTTLNARRLVELAQRPEIPVLRGCASPLGGPAGTAGEVHGRDGLGDLVWDEPTVGEGSEHAVEFLYRQATSGPLTIIAIGPLTNIATLLEQHPDVAGLLERIVVMGGASFEGNVTPAAEFNIWVDPEAAAVVFGSSCRIDIMPLDLTHQAFLDDDDLARLRAGGTTVGQRLADMLEPYADFHMSWNGNRNLIMHDAMAVYEVISPNAITKQPVKVQVETGGTFARGATFFTRTRRSTSGNLRVGTQVENDAFRVLLHERLATLS